MQRRARNYAGSVAVTDDGRLAAFTAPRGGLMLVFDLASGAEVEMVEATDICGVAAAGGRLRLLDRRGAVPAARGRRRRRRGALPDLAFDNHLVRI